VTLDIAPLVRAIARLDEGLARYRRNETDEQLRDGLIQRFEFTYEQSHRMLKRYLASVAATPGTYDQMPFADLIRTANEQGLLLGAWPAWRTYREMRNKASHTYREDVAVEVVEGLDGFLAEVIHLRDELTDRLS
jgi:nucleotidyltransferase substrate binding protein (TIGR01987 family)